MNSNEGEDTSTKYQPTQTSLWFGCWLVAFLTAFLAIAYPAVGIYYIFLHDPKISLVSSLCLIVFLPIWIYILYRLSLITLVLYSWARENRMIKKAKMNSHPSN